MIKGNNVVIQDGVYIGENVVLEDNVFIERGCIINDNVTIKEGTTIGANCILGEHQMDFYKDHKDGYHPLVIGAHSIIRSGSIIYGDTTIGDYFTGGHRITIREKTVIGHHSQAGTLTDIQGTCTIGNYVHMHSNVHIGQLSTVKDYAWLFPYVVLTNDPTPPSNNFVGATIEEFAVVAVGSVILPGVTVGADSLVAAGAIVTKNVESFAVVGGSPAKQISDTRKIKNHITGEAVYPWRYTFDRGMPWEGIGYEQWIEAKAGQASEQ